MNSKPSIPIGQPPIRQDRSTNIPSGALALSVGLSDGAQVPEKQVPEKQVPEKQSSKHSDPNHGQKTRQIVARLQKQLQHFQTRSPSRSLPSLLADTCSLDLANHSDHDPAFLETQSLVPDCRDDYQDWDDLNAIPLDSDLKNQQPGEDETDHKSLAPSPPSIAALSESAEFDRPDGTENPTALAETDTESEGFSSSPRTIYPTPCPQLNQWFPDQGIPAGSLLEVVCSQVGAGATHFCLALARAICGDEGLLVVIDRRHDFHAATLSALGFDLQNVLLVRPDNDEDHGWALEQALHHPSVTAVWTRIDWQDSRYQRRWQLAAEKSSAVGLLQRPNSVVGVPSWAFAQLRVTPNPHSSLLTANQAYYQTQEHQRLRPPSMDSMTPRDENWILDVQALKIRGRFDQPTLRLELHNQVHSTNSLLTWRPPHPNDPAVTRNTSPVETKLHEVDSDGSSAPAVPPAPGTSLRTPREYTREKDRLRLVPRLADSTPRRRPSSA